MLWFYWFYTPGVWFYDLVLSRLCGSRAPRARTQLGCPIRGSKTRGSQACSKILEISRCCRFHESISAQSNAHDISPAIAVPHVATIATIANITTIVSIATIATIATIAAGLPATIATSAYCSSYCVNYCVKKNAVFNTLETTIATIATAPAIAYCVSYCELLRQLLR